MKLLKIVLTPCVLAISSSLFTSGDRVHGKLMPPHEGGINEVKTTIAEYLEKLSFKWTQCKKYDDFYITARIKNLKTASWKSAMMTFSKVNQAYSRNAKSKNASNITKSKKIKRKNIALLYGKIKCVTKN